MKFINDGQYEGTVEITIEDVKFMEMLLKKPTPIPASWSVSKYIVSTDHDCNCPECTIEQYADLGFDKITYRPAWNGEFYGLLPKYPWGKDRLISTAQELLDENYRFKKWSTGFRAVEKRDA